METQMMPTIRIEEDVMEGLKSLAEPFTDTPNSVIRRLLLEKGVSLKAAPSAKAHTSAVAEEPSTSQKTCELFLLHVLAKKFDGRASKSDATKAAIDLMKSRNLGTAADLERVSSGETRIENTIAWARNALKEQGLVSRESGRGMWELTPEGIDRASQIILPRK
jgi:hypothetical protein